MEQLILKWASIESQNPKPKWPISANSDKYHKIRNTYFPDNWSCVNDKDDCHERSENNTLIETDPSNVVIFYKKKGVGELKYLSITALTFWHLVLAVYLVIDVKRLMPTYLKVYLSILETQYLTDYFGRFHIHIKLINKLII